MLVVTKYHSFYQYSLVATIQAIHDYQIQMQQNTEPVHQSEHMVMSISYSIVQS